METTNKFFHHFIRLVYVENLSEYKEVGFIFRSLVLVGRGKYNFRKTNKCAICDMPELEHTSYVQEGIIRADRIDKYELNMDDFRPKIRVNSQFYDLDGERVLLIRDNRPKIMVKSEIK